MLVLKRIAFKIWDKLLIACGTLLVLLPISPLNGSFAGIDSGVFLYFGWRILNGELPYRDIWDHKPPVIFYLNALGEVITNHSRWGVWLIECVSLFLAALIGFYLLKKLFGVFPALVSLLLGLITLTFVIANGNLTEEYALPFQFLALWLFYDGARQTSSPSFLRQFLIGFVGALAFFTKQTTIGIWLAIIIYSTIIMLKRKQTRQWFRRTSFIVAGSLVVGIFIILFFYFQGALANFWDAAFRFNLYYSTTNTNLIKRLSPILTGIAPLTKVGLLQFAMIGYAVGILLIILKRDLVKDWEPLLLVGLIDLPIELIFISLSGNSYLHYYMTILPVLFIFTGLAFWSMFSQLSAWGIPQPARSLFQVGVIVILLWTSFPDYKNQVVISAKPSEDPRMNYIISHTSPDDYVLMWPNVLFYNFYSQRRSPDLFVYQRPLYTRGYGNEQMILQFLEDVIQKHPRFIIDTHRSPYPLYHFPIQTVKISEDVDFLKLHYRIDQELNGWTFYEYTESAPLSR